MFPEIVDQMPSCFKVCTRQTRNWAKLGHFQMKSFQISSWTFHNGSFYWKKDLRVARRHRQQTVIMQQ